MRCNRRMLCLKVKDFFILTLAFSAVIVLITVLNHKPSIRRNAPEFGGAGYGGALENHPGKFLAKYKPTNISYCKFNYDLPLDLRWDAAVAPQFSPELGDRSPYRVLYNAVAPTAAPMAPAVQSPAGGATTANGSAGTTVGVTFATHITPEFVQYVAEIARHWEGAVSVAAFVPDSDVTDVIRYFIRTCSCLPEMSRVSLHLVYPKNYPPYLTHPRKADPSTTCITNVGNTSPNGQTYGGQMPASFRTIKKLPYPVNVARNVARTAAGTEYVLVADAELMPSRWLGSGFMRMVAKMQEEDNGKRAHHLDPLRRAFVVPVFEIERFERIPRTKRDLLRLVRDEKALYFHRHICSHCQKFPGIETWLQQDPGQDHIKPLVTVKREYPYHRWEPIYIGTKDEPLYSELLSWEGKQDKMTQMLEMCLKRYSFVILDGAFLIHWPGVKRKSMDMKIKNQWRYPYLVKNMRQYTNIVNKLAVQYSKTPKCKVQ